MKNEDITKECREELWPKNTVQTLIVKFEDVYVNLNCGNLGKKQWIKWKMLLILNVEHLS